ncbi:MAG: alpha/beta fold hydrolase [Gammaproteobacteria bacterium]|jgi:medium-chain acyl-[acyl-carrier-protein] hydrolase|nr:alpha/beta fold hydrolase [Gammaproteobacteria bacterium]MBU0770287.1 alpha/beta fold hydrolase [Gammaproteobacteria bacterium]MBU0856519.1 alpha/beta fold hydrolase [Gammaproteobacteria bacterium]MBU1845455.1 alpha/beta fold hydrolase [Gammaproteobacteria bacterium]
MPPEGSGRLVRICDGGAGAPSVLAIPYAGGSAQSYFAWKPLLSGRVSLHALELPGRGRCYGQPAPASLLALADGLASTLQHEGLQPDLVFGHSLGALIAFELLRALRRRALTMPPRALMSGRIAPSRPRSFGLPRFGREDLVAYLRDLGGTPDSVLGNDAMVDMMLPILQQDLAMIAGYDYRAEPALDIDIVALGGFDDERVPLEGLLGWQQECAGRFEMRMCPGGHFFVETARDSVADLLHELAGPGLCAAVA